MPLLHPNNTSCSCPRFDPVMVLMEYLRIDNLRLIDLFQFLDTRGRGLVSRDNLREGIAVCSDTRLDDLIFRTDIHYVYHCLCLLCNFRVFIHQTIIYNTNMLLLQISWPPYCCCNPKPSPKAFRFTST